MTSQRPKVLIVDDDEDIVLLLHRALYQDNHSYDVLVASTAEIAQEILAGVHVDVLVTDVRLPERSGMDLLSWSARESPDTRVIIMTACDTAGMKDRAHAFGCLRLLRKPLDLDELRATILQALDRPGSFSGAISELLSIDVIQMLCIARKTTALIFCEGASSGALYLEQGQPIHAVWDDLVGEEAFYRMMNVQHGAFHTGPLPQDIGRTIKGDCQFLLMEGLRRQDEAARDRGHGDASPSPSTASAEPPSNVLPPPPPSPAGDLGSGALPSTKSLPLADETVRVARPSSLPSGSRGSRARSKLPITIGVGMAAALVAFVGLRARGSAAGAEAQLIAVQSEAPALDTGAPPLEKTSPPATTATMQSPLASATAAPVAIEESPNPPGQPATHAIMAGGTAKGAPYPPNSARSPARKGSAKFGVRSTANVGGRIIRTELP